MKKLLLTIFVSLMWCNTAFAESTLPPCQGDDDMKWTNCFGTYLKKDFKKNGLTKDYTGEFGSKPGKREGKGSSNIYKEGSLIQPLMENLKMMKQTDKEPLHGQREISSLENLKMVSETEKELTRLLVESHTKENGKITNFTDKELKNINMETSILENGKMENSMV